MIGDLFDSPWKILIVAVVLIVLFGSKKLPYAARSLGQSMRILKREVQGLAEDDTEPDAPLRLRPPAARPTGSRRPSSPRRRGWSSSSPRLTRCSSRSVTCSGLRRWIRLRSRRGGPSSPASSWLDVGSGGRR